MTGLRFFYLSLLLAAYTPTWALSAPNAATPSEEACYEHHLLITLKSGHETANSKWSVVAGQHVVLNIKNEHGTISPVDAQFLGRTVETTGLSENLAFVERDSHRVHLIPIKRAMILDGKTKIDPSHTSPLVMSEVQDGPTCQTFSVLNCVRQLREINPDHPVSSLIENHDFKEELFQKTREFITGKDYRLGRAGEGWDKVMTDWFHKNQIRAKTSTLKPNTLKLDWSNI